MSKFKVDVNSGPDHPDAAPAANCSDAPHDHCAGDLATKVAVIGVVVVGAALIEAALLPGILIGAAAAMAPKVLPKLGQRMQPMFNSAVRGAYKLGRKARSAVGEAQERMHDIAAEVTAEEVAKAGTPPTHS